ncbi:hypothetical protein [Endozoicomonas sp. SCSIO W0465]|uniref:hypothetical protein n=1 Tax=Endozoicomonas sp. SCSIO W0465 TaxID=2918516 RepID=UPI002075475A|nr:hypothetical protein [Endozoicomonas sp. SCSIO W0465]USE38619.1 hypothetical protein MJO57_10870 [Endozoicomonas sp. SCSIO W0465]
MLPLTHTSSQTASAASLCPDEHSEPLSSLFLPQSSFDSTADHKALATYNISDASHPAISQRSDTVSVSTSQFLNKAVSDSKAEKSVDQKHSYLLPENFITCAIEHYTSTGDTSVLTPLVKDPPSWSEVHESLKSYYIKWSHLPCLPCCQIKHDTPLNEIISWRKMFLTQIPVKETVEGICRIIEYFRDGLKHRAPNQPLVIAGIASGNAIYERAIQEYFQKQQGSKARCIDGGDLVQLSDDLLIHCSDISDEGEIYRSSDSPPMMPVAKRDYRHAVSVIAEILPKAGILLFASWIPLCEDGWFDSLVQHPQIVGLIHLRDSKTCGRASKDFFTLKKKTPQTDQRLDLIKPGNKFWNTYFDILGWGANDSLQQGRKEEIQLSTVLEVKYPFSVFGVPKLPEHLLYSDEFRKNAFCKLPLKKDPDSDYSDYSDSD